MIKSRFKISKVHYSNSDGIIISENLNQLLHTTHVHITYGIRNKYGTIPRELPIMILLENKRLYNFIFSKY